MTTIRFIFVAAILGSLALAASYSAEPAKAEEPFHKELLAVAADYMAWGRVDDEMRWAPEFCIPGSPGQARVSASKDETTHGKKIYSLFAKDRKDYVGSATDKAPVGQVIVKQSWVPEEIMDEKEKPSKEIDLGKVIHSKTPDGKPGPGDHLYPYVWKSDKVFKAAKQADLFIMMKLDPKTPGTDVGWVYGTVSPDGKKVTAAGKVESCMKCHQDAKIDRQFGLGK